jgi:amino acid transporter
MTHLRKVMGFWDLVLFYIVTSFSIRWVATAAATGPSALAVWVIACVAFFIPLAYCVLRLASIYPDEGGLYIWTKKAFGDFAGFMTGWNYWGSNLPYFATLLYFAAGNLLFIGGSSWLSLSNNSTYFIIVSIIGLTLGVVLNLIGLNVAKWLHNLGALGAWIPAVVLVILAPLAWARFGPATDLSLAALVPVLDLKNVVFWSTIAFAFAGVEGASVMGDEVQNPKRNIPRAVPLAGAVMTIFYIAATASVLIAVPQSEVTGLQGVTQAIDAAAGRVGLRPIVPFMAALISLSALGGVAAWFAAAARLPFVAGVDRFLPEGFGRVHPRFGTPYVALLIQAVIAFVIVLLGQAGTSVKGAYDILVSMSVITYFLPYLLMFAALIKLDRTPLAGILGSVGILTTVISIILAVIPPADEPNKALALGKTIGLTAVMIGVGAAIYRRGRSTRKHSL